MDEQMLIKDIEKVIEYIDDKIASLHERFCQGEKYSVAIDELREVSYLLKLLVKK